MKTWQWLLIVLAVAVVGATDCVGEGERASESGLRVQVDSARHVACYSFFGANSVACVAMDSTNTHAVGR